MSAAEEVRRRERELSDHLEHVYLCLLSVAVTATIGCSIFYCGCFQFGFISSLMSFVLIIALHYLPDNGKNFWLRYFLLAMFGLCAGQLIGPLMRYVGTVSPRLITAALVGSTVIFLTFSITACYSAPGKYLFLSGILTAACNIITVANLANLFFKSYWIHYVQTHCSVAVMAGFILYDTQIIIEKFQSGDRDSINHSLDLFFVTLNLLRKVLILLAERRKTTEL